MTTTASGAGATAIGGAPAPVPVRAPPVNVNANANVNVNVSAQYNGGNSNGSNNLHQYAQLVLARPPKRVLHLRKRRRMSALAEHFEYTHLPAHLSAIQNFHIRALLCHRGNLLIVQLQRHLFVECALIDMRLNKFRGVFGRQVARYD